MSIDTSTTKDDVLIKEFKQFNLEDKIISDNFSDYLETSTNNDMDEESESDYDDYIDDYKTKLYQRFKDNELRKSDNEDDEEYINSDISDDDD
jgi:hypothetical protein